MHPSSILNPMSYSRPDFTNPIGTIHAMPGERTSRENTWGSTRSWGGGGNDVLWSVLVVTAMCNLSGEFLGVRGTRERGERGGNTA